VSFRTFNQACRFLILLGTLVSAVPMTWAGNDEKPQVEDLSIQSQINPRLTLKGVHYFPKVRHPKGQGPKPIVLFHGLVSTTYHFKDLGQALAGFGGDAGEEQRLKLTEPLQKRIDKLTRSEGDHDAEIHQLREALQGLKDGREVYMFNFRGHGKGDHLTEVTDPRPGDYSFRNMPTEDVPTAVDYVFERTGLPVILGGHSTGSMIETVYLNGAVLDYANSVEVLGSPHGVPFAQRPVLSVAEKVGMRARGELITLPNLLRDPAVVLARSGRVAEHVSLGGPTSFAVSTPQLKKLAKAILDNRKRLPVKIDFGVSAEVSPTSKMPRGLRQTVKGAILGLSDPFSFYLLPTDVVKGSNLSTAEVAGIREKGVSSVSRELALDFGHWMYTKVWEDAYTGFSFEFQDPANHVPRLNIAGQLDGLSPLEAVVQSMNQRPVGANIRTAILEGTSHVDMVIGEHAIRNTYPLIEKFDLDSERIGPAGSVTPVAICGVRDRGKLLKSVIRWLVPRARK
jgi:hypothetical protein